MFVIPVIDVRHGVVVRAVAGDRAQYAPIVSPLFEGCDPVAAVRGLMALHPFPVIYLADLDGIEGRGADLGLVGRLRQAAPGAELWVDNGAADAGRVAVLARMEGVVPVAGSETGLARQAVAGLIAAAGGRLILSLDFRSEAFVGDPALLDDVSAWPERVIAMTLARVGGVAGPDLARVAGLVARHGRGQVFAAGGVRGKADLQAVRVAGAAGVLVSSALHAQKLTAGDL